jgi:hypothetical protein
MKAMTYGRLGFGVLASAVLFAGCAGGGSLPLQTPRDTAAVRAGAAHYNGAGSWVSPDAASQDLLYVSDSRGSVYMFSYPAGKLVGQLKGFQSPAGLCSDAAGDVYVVNTNALDILKFKHGGTKSIEELNDFGHYPFGCAVDPMTGDVAVANYVSTLSFGPGSLSIFKAGHGAGSSYTDPSFNTFYFCSYDDKGNAFVDGADYGSYNTQFAELAKGSSTLSDVKLNQTIGYPGGVQWDGKYMAIQDTYTHYVYRFKISGSKGTSMGTVKFKGNNSNLITQFWLDGSTIIMPYGTLSRSVRKVGYWNYPQGGALTKSWGIDKASELIGVTISRAKK